MGDEKMNKRGTLVLRDIMFMLILFGGILALASIFVINMAEEYSNTDMNTEYTAENSIGNLGNKSLANISGSLDIMKNETETSVGVVGIVTGTVKGIGTVLSVVIKSPIYVKVAITTLFTALRIPTEISFIVGNIIMFLIYATIIFVIMSAFLRGGKV